MVRMVLGTWSPRNSRKSNDLSHYSVIRHKGKRAADDRAGVMDAWHRLSSGKTWDIARYLLG